MDNIKGLNKLLHFSEFGDQSFDYMDYFKKIANILMNQCVITKRGVNYEIVEIEFYFFTPGHQDVITYPRKLTAGQWFFHSSGVDLTFESNHKHFGGILIRGIRNMSNGKITLGPQKCVDLLWDASDAFKVKENEYPTIVEYPGKLDSNIRNFPRWIPLKDEKKAAKISYWSNRIIENKSQLDKETDKLDIVFSSPYRFIKFDLIDNTPKGWSGYSAKPKI